MSPKYSSQRFERIKTITHGAAVVLICLSFGFPHIFNLPSERQTIKSAPKAAPPERFLTDGGREGMSEFRKRFSEFRTAIGEILYGPSIPDGLGAAHEPSLSERIVSTLSSTISPTASAAAAPMPGSGGFDFDGDGKADTGRWRGSNAEFKIHNSGDGSFSSYTAGSPGSSPVPADYDNDGKTDAASFNAGQWAIRQSSNGQTMSVTGFGTAGDVLVPGNYVGNSAADAAVFRPSNGTWYIRETPSGNITTIQFGTSGDIPVPGDYDGDAVMDPAIFRPSTGAWHILASTNGYYVTSWGVASDIPVAADFDGDGKTDPAVYRGSSGVWYAYKSSAPGQYLAEAWGNYGDQPAPGDYDGDGKADLAVWRPTTGVWYIRKSSDSTYEYDTLGAAGDVAVPSAYLKQIGGTVTGYDLVRARLSPKNATGGTDLYSRNFNWGTSLAGLPGRAGMSAGFGISYNSLVWTRSGNAVHFDTNADNISPGFRFGYATIEPVYYDDTTQKFTYVMVAPSGGRIEFRQTAVSNVYETADSSYLSITTKGADAPNDPVEDIGIEVKGTDGSVTTFEWIAGAFRCSRIQDRNGNYIDIVHDGQGLLRTVTDTLGRVITVNYDAGLYPISVVQAWQANNGAGQNVTHTWASFAYTTKEITTDFSGLAVFGPPNGSVLKVLERITFADGTSTRFAHNSYGQVYKVENYAADGHKLNHVRTDLETPAAGQTDCPRFGQTMSYVENFNGGAEVAVTNTLSSGHQVVDIDGSTVTASVIQVQMQDHPTGNVSNTYIYESGWREGLPVRNDDWSNENGLVLRRSSWTKWTQDDVNLSYPLNPRAIETKVSDSANTKRTTTEYLPVSPGSPVALYGLVKKVEVLDGGMNVLKRVETDHNLDPVYVSRNIIGLPAETRAYGRNDLTQSLEMVSRVSFAYDEGDFAQESNQIVSPVHHSSYFGPSFVTGRGNLTSTTRHDVTGQTAAVTSRIRYDVAGSVVAKLDPLGRKVGVNYSDNFNDSQNRNTFAYPTTVTDPAGNSSTVRYRYDIGANVRAQSPAPAGNAQGKITEREYDEFGRLLIDRVVNLGGAYTRYEYPVNGIQQKVFSTIVDVNGNNTADTGDEVLAEAWSDGAGRVRRSRSEHPGSAGGWAATLVEYDILGRVRRQSVQTEVDGAWNAAGDDAVRGFLWTHQKYDWMGRVVRKINTDGEDSAVLNDSDILISYEGCGCAGGLVTTVQGELVPRDDEPTQNARRTQKVYEDILGRAWKTVVFKWDGTTPYTTTEQAFNGRDQVLRTRQTDNTSAANPQAFQDVTMTFDGHGRAWKTHRPEQRDASDNPTYTIFNYNPDDGVASVADGRGVVTNFAYNSTGLLTDKTHTVPAGSGIPAAAGVVFGYDNLGNRTSMTDGLGVVNYEYDELSRLTAETREFSDALPDAPAGGFEVSYEYSLGGPLGAYTDPYGQRIEYSHDRKGRLNAVNGSTFGGVTDYAHAPNYRAWGALGHLEYGNGVEMNVSYNDRLQAASMSVAKPGPNGNLIFQKSYQYYSDGRIKLVDDSFDPTTHRYDRFFAYDHTGGLKAAKSGIEAHGQTQTDLWYLPFRQSYEHNAFGNLTGRDSTLWNYTNGDWDFEYTMSNNRVVDNGYTFDADGRQTSGDGVGFDFDAAGGMVRTVRSGHYEMTLTADGDGRNGKRSQRLWRESDDPGQPGEWREWKSRYFVYSNVLGRTVTEADGTGKKKRTYVIAAGAVMARQAVDDNNNEVVGWEHRDASGLSARSTSATGYVPDDEVKVTEELDGLGNNVGTHGTMTRPPRIELPMSGADRPRFDDMTMGDCELDGVFVPCSMATRALEAGAAIPSELMDHSRVFGFAFEQHGLGIYSARFPKQVGWHVTPDESILRIYSRFTYETVIFGIRTDTSGVNGGSETTEDERIVSFDDTNDARAALQQAILGSCGAKLEELFKNLKTSDERKAWGINNSTVDTSVLKILDTIIAQSRGGLFTTASSVEANNTYLALNHGGTPVPGGGGLTFMYNGDKYVYVFPRPISTYDYARGRPADNRLIERRIASARSALVSILIHEIAHAAGNKTTFTHSEMDAAAISADSEIGKLSFSNNGGGAAPYFAAFLLKHCGLGFEGQN